MDKALRKKIRNYLTDRIEEIKEGTFVPSYVQVKDLPQFSGINRDEFIIARNEWFKQLPHLASYLSEEEYGQIPRKILKKKILFLVLVSFFVFHLF